ncbi:MAG: transglutaminase-like domain-containing protein [Bacteroidota bacterium]
MNHEIQPKEISALFTLLDDPDEEVFSTVENRLISFGTGIIPNLEHLWEQSISEDVQERIELIIHKLHYKDLTNEFINWKNGDAELLFGALLVAKYQFPEMVAATPLQEIEKMRRNVWIELNSYLTPLEQVKVLESILYNYYKLKGGEIAYLRPNEFMIHKLLESKKGNAITTGILYMVLCEMLDIPVKVINIPQQFILAYFRPQVTSWGSEGHQFDEQIKFYIDPSSGAAYSHQDIETYFSRIHVKPVASYFKPMDNKQIICLLLQEFARCFDDLQHEYKRDELQELIRIIGR